MPSSFFKNLGLLYGGLIIAQAISLMAMPFISRIYEPEQFARYSLIVAISGILSIITTMRLDGAVMVAETVEEKRSLVGLGYLTALFLGIFCYIVLILFDFAFDIELWAYYIPIISVFIGLLNIADKYNNSQSKYWLMSGQRVIKSLIEAVISISLGIWFFLDQGLIFALFLSLCLSFLFVMANFDFGPSLNLSEAQRHYALIKRYKDFPIYLLPHSVLNSSISYLPILVIPILYGEVVLGFYAFGLRIVQAPLGLFAASLNALMFKVTVDYKGNRKKLEFYLFRLILGLFFICLMLMLIFLFGENFFVILFGERWLKAWQYTQIFAPAIIMSFVTSIFSFLPQIYGYQSKAWWLELFSAFMKVSIILIAWMYSFQIESFILSFSAISCFSALIALHFYFTIYNRHIR